MAQKKFGKNTDFDLEVTNAQTKEVYKDEQTLIPKNSSVVVRRIPVGTKSKAQIASDKSDTLSSMGVKTTANLAKANATEEDKLKAMMSQAGEDWDPSQYVRGRGRGFSGSVPNNYVCYRCGKPGHFIRSCPTNGDTRFDVPKVKRTTGIPRMFLSNEGSKSGGSSPLRSQQEDAIKESKKDKSGPAVTPPTQPEPKKVPSELKCPMCNNLLTDAVLIPCCGTSYCDDCIRTYLLDDEHEHVCPACGQENVLPDSLVINKQLRQAVNNFRNPRSSSPFMNTSQLPTASQETKQDTTKPRKEDVTTAKNLDVEKVIVGSGSPARSREGSPKVCKPETNTENSTAVQPTGQVSRPHSKDQQPKEGNIIKHAVQKIEGGKQALPSSRAQDQPRPISGHPREHIPRVPGMRPPHPVSVGMHAPPFPGAAPAMSAARLYVPGGPVVARSHPLKPRPVIVSALHPPAHDPFGIAVRPSFLDPFGHPDEPLPPPMSEEEFRRLQKGFKSRHRKKREVREPKRSKENDRGRNSRERDRGRDQDDRGSDREGRGRRRGREVDYADELSQYRKIQRSRQRSSSWPRSRSRSYSRSESRSYSRSRSRSRSWSQSRSPSRSPTPEGWDRSRDPTPTSSRSASRDISPGEDDKIEEDKTRKRKKRKKHHKHKRDKKQKTSSQEDDRGGSEKISDNDDKKPKRKASDDYNDKPKKKHKKNKEKEDEKNIKKKIKNSKKKQQDRTKSKGETRGQTSETSKVKKVSSSKKKSEERKLEKDKTKGKSTNLSKSKKAKLSEDVVEQTEVRKSKSNKKSNRSTKEKEKSSSDERKKKRKHKSKSKKHKKHKHKKRSKSDESKKDSKPSSGSLSEELSDETADVTVSQHDTGTVSDSSDIENVSTRSERETANDGDDYNDDNDFGSNSPGNDNNDQVSNEDDDKEEEQDDSVEEEDDDDNDDVGGDDDENNRVCDKSDDGVDDNDCVSDSDDDHLSGDGVHVDCGGIQSEEEEQVDDTIIEEDDAEAESASDKEEESNGVGDKNRHQSENHSDHGSTDSSHLENESDERKQTQNVFDCGVEEDTCSYQCESKKDEDACKNKVTIENMVNTDREERKEKLLVDGACIGQKGVGNSDCSHFDDVNGKNRTEISYSKCYNESKGEKGDLTLEDA